MSDGPPAKHEESGSIGSSTLIIPNSNVKTQREKIEQIRCIIEDCSAFLDSLASDPPPQPILAKFFPESVHKEATEFIKLAEQNYCRLRDQVEYENLYWTTQEHVDTELMDRISDLLDNLGRTRPIFQTASNSIFPSVIRPPVSRPIKLFLTTQDALMRRKLEKKRDFEKHPAQIHLSVDTETRIDGELFHQLRPTASHMFPPESASPPGSEDIRAFLQTLAQNGFAESHSHLMSVFKNWETGSITSSTLITVLANVLESHPEVLETFQTVSARMVPSIKINIAVNTHGKISSVTLVLSNKDGLIIPISKELRGLVDEFSTATVITSSSGIRSLLASPNPEQSWNTLANMDERWMAAVIPLLQLELELATCASRIQQCSTLLRRVSRKNCCLPASFLLEDIEREGKNPISGGGFADIWRGHLHNQIVCLKVLRFYMDSDREELFKHLYNEVTVWKQLRHRNVLPFLGVSLKQFTPSFCIISPWMDNGHVVSFLKRNPDHDRYAVISDIAEGIKYLHSLSPPIVHGDIKGSNILVTDDHICCLADFGLAAVSESHAFSTTSTNPGGTTRWLPPEVFLPSRYPDCSKLARDIYAFGCTVLEVITGREPFSEPRLTDVAVMTAVIQGERPSRPENNQWCTDTLWALIEECWAQDAACRPPADLIVDSVHGKIITKDPIIEL